MDDSQTATYAFPFLVSLHHRGLPLRLLRHLLRQLEELGVEVGDGGFKLSLLFSRRGSFTDTDAVDLAIST
jgi:hypothetical protein